MRIKVATATKAGEVFTIETLDLDEPRENEILIRVMAAGVSHIDLLGRDGELPVPLPAVFGREASGWVESIGSKVSKFAPGDYVVLTFYPAYPAEPGGNTGEHKSPYGPDVFDLNFSGFRPDGSSPLSRNGKSIAGAFFGQSSLATHCLARENNLVRAPKDLSWPILAAFGGDVLAGAGAVINRLHPRPGHAIAVFGAGGAGLGAIMAARLCGCYPIIAVDIKATRLELAQSLGASTVIDPDGLEPVEAIRRITGTGIEFSLETTGIPSVARQAIDCLAQGGMCALAAMTTRDAGAALEIRQLLRGRTVCGSLFADVAPTNFVTQLIEFHRRGDFPIGRIIREYRLEDINRAAADMVSGAAVKPILVMPKA
jgi:aryl-alcohol dehydrogenase